jgi:hypothetical protein
VHANAGTTSVVVMNATFIGTFEQHMAVKTAGEGISSQPYGTSGSGNTSL